MIALLVYLQMQLEDFYKDCTTNDIFANEMYKLLTQIKYW